MRLENVGAVSIGDEHFAEDRVTVDRRAGVDIAAKGPGCGAGENVRHEAGDLPFGLRAPEGVLLIDVRLHVLHGGESPVGRLQRRAKSRIHRIDLPLAQGVAHRVVYFLHDFGRQGR